MLEVPQFLDLVHFYRLDRSEDPENEPLNLRLSGGQRISEDKPEMMTEAARAIPVPSFWRGSTTASAATLLADKMKEARR